MSESEAAAGPDINAKSPGRALSEAREARNLSLAEVAQQLKLSASQVAALEADAYDRLPGPVFVRGFVRNYARLMELDADELVESVGLPHETVQARAAVPFSRDIPFPEQRKTRWMPYAIALLVLAGTVVGFELFFSMPDAVMVSTVSPNVPPARVAPPAMPSTPAKAVTVESPSQSAPLPQNEVVAAPLFGAVIVQVSEPTPAPAQKKTGIAELHFVFETPSWIEVRDSNDRILFSQLNPAGTEQHVQGRAPLSLVVGNAQGVRLTYNGQAFDLAPHTRVQVARFTLE